MRKIETKAQAHQKQEAEKQFGCNLRALQLEILKALNAPELAIQTKQTQHCLSARDWATLAKFGLEQSKPQAPLSSESRSQELSPSLKIARQNPLFYIELSRFYLHYYLGSSNPKRISRAIAVTAAGLDMAIEQVRRLTTQSLLKTARKYRLPFCQNAICQVFEDVQEECPDVADNERGRSTTAIPATIKKPVKTAQAGSIEIAASSVKQSEAKDVFTPERSFLELLKQMKEAPTSFDSAASLMTQMVEQMHVGLKLNRAAIYVFTKDKKRLKSYYTAGIEKTDPLKRFETQIIKGTIFKVLYDKPSALWLKPSARKEVADLVPMNFKQCSQRDEGLFASVFVRSKPVAILYADQEQGYSINEVQFRYFKLATKALESALVMLGNQQSNHAKS